MSKVELSDVFNGEFLNIISKYKKRIQNILSHYDIAIFMARKAICFYDALRYNDEIFETKCRVISSRVLDYNTLDTFQGKKIAVIDDVVVRGQSLSRVASILLSADIEADYYVVACEEDFCKAFNNDTKILKETYNIFPSNSIYQLSGVITKYIEASMRTFNVDSPLFDLSNNKSIVKNLLYDRGTVCLTSGTQSKFGIESRDLYFQINDEADCGVEVAKLVKNSIIKIRFYLDDERITAVPFVLMQASDIKEIDSIYTLFKCYSTDKLIYNSNERIKIENKFKLVSYILSYYFFINFANNEGLVYKKDLQNEIIQFNNNIDEMISDEGSYKVLQLLDGISIRNIGFSVFSFNDYVRLGYQFISSRNPEEQLYEDYKGLVYGKWEDDSDRLNKVAFTYMDLLNWINNQVNECSNNSIYVSSVVDVFIDLGLIVPAILHIGDNIILRAYKMGEYSKLTRDQINSFLRMLFEYEKYVDRYLGKTEFEKLCVIFFKQEILRRRFVELENYEEGSYGIAYSYYGPRVSSSTKPYMVSTESALITDFSDRDNVEKIEDKYHIRYLKETNDNVLNIECQFFAYGFSELNRVFLEHSYSRENSFWGGCIHTLSQYLTMLAIGLNPYDRILSLCAEICFVKNIKDDIFVQPTSELPMKKYKSYLDGINNGLWKYRCFKENAFEKTTHKLYELNPALFIYITAIITPYDRSESLEELIDEFGGFLYKAVYIINELLRYSNRLSFFKLGIEDEEYEKTKLNNHNNQNTIFSVANYYYPKMKELRKEIEKTVNENIQDGSLELVAKEYTKELQREAYRFIEKCDLFIEKKNARINNINMCLVIHSQRKNLPKSFSRVQPCKLEGISNSGETEVFSIRYKRELNSIMSSVIKETLGVVDCEYLLIDLYDESHGYYQVEEIAKGLEIERLIKNIVENKIHTLSDTYKHLFVYKTQDSLYDDFGDVKISLLDTFDCDYQSIYKLYKYSIDGGNNNMNEANNISISIKDGGTAIVGKDIGEFSVKQDIKYNDDSEQLIKQLLLFIDVINKSDELNDSQKKSLINIMNKAKRGIEKNDKSEEKEAKDAFTLVKDFIISGAPKLIEVLANCSQIASYFGIILPFSG